MTELKLGRREIDALPSSNDQRQEDRITALEKGQKDILDLLKPISETYTTVSTMGRWGMAFMVFISILIGVVLGFRNLTK